MKFNIDQINLPIKEIIPEIKSFLCKENVLIVTAPPGTGKSTLLPLVLLNEKWLNEKKILLLEPRRLAARMIAARMAELIEENPGQTIGYRIRLEKKVSEKTRIEIVTEGILTRMLQSDSILEGVGMVIFDEFHERSIHADTALAFCRETQQILRPDLRIMIMSATIDTNPLEHLLRARSIMGYCRQFHVEIKYTGDTDLFLIPEMTSGVIANAVKENPGDVLVFLPGESEIKKCESILRKNLSGFVIHPLYGRLPQSKQNAAVFPDKNGKRKIVLATSIAETSLTIEGIKIVVDSGFGRTSSFDPKSGLSKLETVLISKDSADQRAGRAGRLSEGVCYRMWTKATHARRKEHRTPEISEADLTSLALEMANWGVKNPDDLTWVTPPPSGTLAQAFELLNQIDALKNGSITSHGKLIQSLPCHPRIAHMLLMAKDEGLISLATDIAAILEEKDPLSGTEAGIDINIRIEALRRFRAEKTGNIRFRQIEKIAASYRDMFKITPDNSPVNPFETGLLLVFAYPERIASARPGNNAQFQLSNGRLVMAHHSDDLAHESWLAVAHLDARDGMGKIFLASPLNPQDLAPLVKERENISWETKNGGLQTVSELRIGNIILQRKPLPSPDKDIVRKKILEAIRLEGEHLLSFNDDVNQLQNRVLSLRQWRPEKNWPDFSTGSLLKNSEKWLAPYLINIKKNDDLERLNLKDILIYSLSAEHQANLMALAPEKVVVPSGSSIKLNYAVDGSSPVLAVRLQEVFGMIASPKVNAGQIPVLMHLLSPGFKLVQITSDLNSFWNVAYFEVRKEMKRRYPKHFWPYNPLAAEAVRGVKRR
ncbi:MAG: ATP-dependent helicase HrpB [Bacteroidales bacterium]|nr:ATP-dependent helicase HrpB [Bacteroidales bacterium]